MSTTTLNPPRARSGGGATLTALARSLRTVGRVPALLVSPLLMSVFFLVIYSGQLGEVGASYMDGTSFGTFILPLILVTGAVTGAAAAGELLVRDLRSGYLDRLVLAHGSPAPYVVAAAATGVLVVAAQGVLTVLAGTLVGFRAESAGGVLTLLGYTVLLGLGVGLLGAAAAIRWAESSMVNLVTVAFFGLSFFTGFLAPSGRLSGWMDAVSTANPLTYVVEAMRESVTPGGSSSAPLALAVLGAVLAAGVVACTWALHERQEKR
jgi:ABC-2 type transport system permease protein